MAEPQTGNYFVAAYPPFSAWTKEEAAGVANRLLDLPPEETPFGFYVHLPFCEKRCDYCYYLSFAGTPAREIASYIDLVVAEAALYARLPRFAGRKPSFVYFGGGTPSLLKPELLELLLTRLAATLGWQAAEEITFECSPKTTSHEKLAILQAAGVSRISLGVQQLNDTVLRANRRIHLVADVERAMAAVHEFSFPEVNLDLIAGLLGQTDASFEAGLANTIALAPDCVTIYQLEVPRNTPLYQSVSAGEAADLADWETKRRRVLAGFDILTDSGFRIRNAYSAATGKKHPRFVYGDEQYRGADLLGLGLSSFSYVAGMHFQNATSPKGYSQAVAGGQLPIVRGYPLAAEEQLVREFILQLKSGATSRAYFQNKFQIDPVERFARPLAELAAEGWLTWNDEQIELTRQGLVRADRLLPAFYLEQHRTSSYW